MRGVKNPFTFFYYLGGQGREIIIFSNEDGNWKEFWNIQEASKYNTFLSQDGAPMHKEKFTA